MGNALAKEVQRVLTEKNITVDVVIPVPDTSRVAALNLAQALGLPYREGFVKNRYIGRTFIMPEQEMRYVSAQFLPITRFSCFLRVRRKKNVRRKLNAMALEFAGKNVLIVDGKPRASYFFLLSLILIQSLPLVDSIVRGTTSREIIQMAKDVGSKKVIMASCAPPIRYPNVYGIDMPSRAELVAHGRTSSQVAQAIGADLVIFQTLPDLVASVRQLNPSIDHFECSVFDGEYVTGGVEDAYLDHLEGIRSDNMKTKTAAAAVNGLAGALPEEVAKVLVAVGDAGVSGTGGGGSGSHTPDRPADGTDDTIGLHNTWKLS